jgi:hypothetical protein
VIKKPIPEVWVPLLLHCLSFAVRSSQSMTGDGSGASSDIDQCTPGRGHVEGYGQSP